MSGWWRWLGFGGALLLALSACLAGALPSGDPGEGLRTGGFPAVPGSFIAGLACWLIGAVAVSLAWIKSPPTGLRQTLLTGAMWAMPLLIAPPLGSRDAYAYACQGWVWWHGGNPYAVGVAEGGCPWAGAVPSLWWDTPTPYGPFAVLLSGLAAATGSQLGALIVIRLTALAATALLAWQLPRLAVQCGLSAAAAARLGLVTPLLLIHGLSGGHNDIVVAALVVSALTIASRPKIGAIAAGALIAGAVAVKITAIVALPFVLLLAAKGRLRASASAGAAAVVAFVVLSWATGLGLGWVGALRNTGELAQWSSVPTAVGMTVGYLLRPFGVESDVPIAATRALGLLALAAIAVLTLRKAWQHRHDTRTVVVVCGALMAATAVLGPVFYPWYAIAPLAVLAAASPTSRWLFPATVICTFLTLPNGLGLPVLTKAVGAFAITATVALLVVQALRKGAQKATA